MNRRTVAIVAILPLIGLTIQGGIYLGKQLRASASRRNIPTQGTNWQKTNWVVPKYHPDLLKSAGPAGRRFMLNKSDPRLSPKIQVTEVWPPQPGDYPPPYENEADRWRVMGTIAYPKKGQPNTSLVLAWETEQRWDAVQKKWNISQRGNFSLIKE